MRRAQRLFDIIQHLRRRKLIRASDLAERLEVSERTIYRDIAELMASELKVPIEAIGRLRGQAPVKPVPIGAIKRGAIHAAALGEVG